MTKKITFTLPVGEAVFPKLNEIDVYQPTDKKGKPSGAEKRRFITKMKYDDENHRKIDEYLKKQLVKLDLEDGKLPWKPISKQDKTLTLEMTSGEDYPPPFVDAQGNEVPRSKVKIGGGSRLKVNVTVNGYTGFGGGINLYINWVQIIELKKSQRTIQVEKEEGFTWTGDDDDAEETSDAKQDEAPSTEDDDIPF